VVQTGSISLMTWASEYSNEPSGSIHCWEVLEWLYNWRRKLSQTASSAISIEKKTASDELQISARKQ
jgi:hypothetical protein